MQETVIEPKFELPKLLNMRGNGIPNPIDAIQIGDMYTDDLTRKAYIVTSLGKWELLGMWEKGIEDGMD